MPLELSVIKSLLTDKIYINPDFCRNFFPLLKIFNLTVMDSRQLF